MRFSKQFFSASPEFSTLERPVPAPYLRKTFRVRKELQKAELTVCGLGFYRFWLNGTEKTKGLLSPYITNPDRVLDYDCYDLTPDLQNGLNVLGFQLGNGMQNSFGGYVWDFDKTGWRSAPKMAFCLELSYRDGETELLEGKDGVVWTSSPVLSDDLRLGESYDARKEIPGWNLPGFDDSDWPTAAEATLPSGKPTLCEAAPIAERGVQKPVRIERNVKLVFRENDTVYEGCLFVYAQNASGIPHLKLRGKSGQRLTLLFGEHIFADGHISLDNLRFIRPEYRDMPLYIQKDEYVCSGNGTEEWEPVFTYHGYRFCLVCGLSEEQISEDLLTFRMMNTRLPSRGTFECSDSTLNELQRMARESVLSNFHHFPTDCPHREKNGWTGDAAVSAEYMLLNFEAENNFREWLKHIRAAMTEEGNLPAVVPTDRWGYGIGPAWDRILVELPYRVYTLTGDRQIVKENLTAIFRYVYYLSTRRNDRGLIGYGWGDWCAPFGPRSPVLFTSSIFAMDLCRKAAFLFREFGKTEAAEYCGKLADSFRASIREHLIDLETMTAAAEDTPYTGSQTSQALALYFGIFEKEEEPAAFRVLLDKLREQKDHLDTGILGVRAIFPVLSRFGRADLACRILTDPDYPSFGNFVARGETALPESFNTEDMGTDSLNHHFFGSFSGWLIRDIAGIRYNPEGNDLRKVCIAPGFSSGLTFAKGSFVSPEGRISTDWEALSEKDFRLTVRTPAGMKTVTEFGTCETVSFEETEEDGESVQTFLLRNTAVPSVKER